MSKTNEMANDKKTGVTINTGIWISILFVNAVQQEVSAIIVANYMVRNNLSPQWIKAYYHTW